MHGWMQDMRDNANAHAGWVNGGKTCESCHERLATGVRVVPWSGDGANICDECAEPTALAAAAEAIAQTE